MEIGEASDTEGGLENISPVQGITNGRNILTFQVQPLAHPPLLVHSLTHLPDYHPSVHPPTTCWSYLVQGHPEFSTETVETLIPILTKNSVIPNRLPEGQAVEDVKRDLASPRGIDTAWLAALCARFLFSTRP